MRRFVTILVTSLAALALSVPSHANGRFPRSQRLLEDASDADHLVLAATYGLLVTRDRGRNWYHVCEASFAEPGLETDPVVSLTPSGALLTSVYSALARSGPAGCDFTTTLGEAADEAVPDFTIAREGGRVLALRVSTPEDGSIENQLFASDDDGRTFSPLGPPLPSSIRSVATVDVAPSDPRRVYVSGLAEDRRGVLLRSDDGGETFLTTTLATNSSESETPYIAAVDPDDADIIYVRTDLWEYDDIDGVDYANDGLLYSDDGGETLREVFRTNAKLYGFALAPDGQSVVLGYGDPVDGGGRFVLPEALGLYESSTVDGAFAFEKLFPESVTCLSHTESGLYVCAAQSRSGFELGFRSDTDFTLSTEAPFTRLLDLAELRGPLECPSCSTGARCEQYWEDTCSRLGAANCGAAGEGSGGTPECVGAGGESGRVSNGGGGGAPDETAGREGGSTHDAGGAAGASGMTASGPGANPGYHRDSGCNCRQTGATRERGFGALGVCLALLLVGRRRRPT